MRRRPAKRITWWCYAIGNRFSSHHFYYCHQLFINRRTPFFTSPLPHLCIHTASSPTGMGKGSKYSAVAIHGIADGSVERRSMDAVLKVNLIYVLFPFRITTHIVRRVYRYLLLYCGRRKCTLHSKGWITRERCQICGRNGPRSWDTIPTITQRKHMKLKVEYRVLWNYLLIIFWMIICVNWFSFV